LYCVIDAFEKQQLASLEASGAEISEPASASDADSPLLALAVRFETLAAELAACQRAGGELATCLYQRSFVRDGLVAGIDADAKTKQAESILAHLYPIEQAIMATPARTIVGLGVKARHAAYVMSQYWEAPIDQIDWDARAVRLLIEAVCEVCRVPLPFRNLRADE
jgi:hypothetical protein